MPPYFSRAVVTADRRPATLAFGIRLLPLDRQPRVIEDMRSRLDPPPGGTARLAGLPVLAAQANDQGSAEWRRMLTLEFITVDPAHAQTTHRYLHRRFAERGDGRRAI